MFESRKSLFVFRGFPLIFGIFALTLSCGRDGPPGKFVFDEGGIIRGDVSEKRIALVFTGHEFAEGGDFIREVLRQKEIRAGFFFTGDFYREEKNAALIGRLREDGHYLGPHSDKHLLYCSWENRRQLLVTREEFSDDILRNYQVMEAFGIAKEEAPFFIPPYEWFNEEIVNWAKELGLVLCNYTPGTLSSADYTTPEMSGYRSSERIFQSIFDHERSDGHGLNGFILLFHIGTHPDRTDKFYRRFDELLNGLLAMDYRLVGIDDLLGAG
ncbi:MAG: polysaccharide deacetylase family protein [Candidatus Aminicenantales bacterium]